MRFRCSLRVDCTFCGYSRTFGPAETYKAFGNRPLRGLARQCRCNRCGFKQASAQVLSPV